MRQSTRDGTSFKGDAWENCSLPGKAEKGKEKKSQSKGYSNQGDKKKDFSKINFFYCDEMRQYATKFPYKKAGKKPLGGAEGEALS